MFAAYAPVWDAHTGKLIGETIKHMRVFSARFSPDGKRIVIVSGYED